MPSAFSCDKGNLDAVDVDLWNSDIDPSMLIFDREAWEFALVQIGATILQTKETTSCLQSVGA